MFGPHLTLDLYGCDKDKLNDHGYVYEMLNEMPEMLGMHKFSAPQLTKIPVQPNSFDKGGLTGFVILVESHLSIHTFPADGFASFDIFSCKYFSEDSAMKYLMEKLGAEKVEVNRLERGREYVKHYPRNVQKATVIAAKERSLAR
ncbi:adenosylmethionine decarboxylase [Candidatus Woesearchaeota archaeon]|nr:adenosylmethionine decarboxylase [Candidatus Woesearchaeota archaeon]